MDGWDSDIFEDQVATSVIGLFERPSHIERSNFPTASLAEVEAIRKRGVFVQHPNRMVFDDELDAPIEEIYDGHFVEAQSVSKQRPQIEGFVNTTYASYTSIRRAHSPKDGFYAVASGDTYCFIALHATDDGRLEAAKQYFTARQKIISPCAIDNGKVKRSNYSYRPAVLDGKSLAESVLTRVTMLLNTMADRKHQWSIQANDSQVGVELQCYHEEVKSLLYARSLPMTATGRKRPVLHLVAAHRRRVKEGIEIDISQFLRGVRKVEMGNAMFEVKPPAIEVQKMLATKAQK